LNVHYVSDVRQTEIYTAEPLEPETSEFEIEMVIEELKIHIGYYQVLIKSQQKCLKQGV
jgi:hypothetical protein